MGGNFTEVNVPEIQIPGTAPLVYKLPEELLDEIWNSDEFAVNDLEEEFLMFPGEILDKKARKQDGPHKHIKWRQAARAFNTDDRQQRAAEIERTKQEQLLQEARSLDQINEITERNRQAAKTVD